MYEFRVVISLGESKEWISVWADNAKDAMAEATSRIRIISCEKM